MARYLDLQEAAKQLGISPDQLVEMRSNGEIRGYRDGASWKFKMEDLEAAAANLAGGSDQPVEDDDMPLSFGDLLAEATDEKSSPAAAASSGLGSPKPSSAKADDASILNDDDELILADETTLSTVIGKAGTSAPPKVLEPRDSDLQLATDSGLNLAPSKPAPAKPTPGIPAPAKAQDLGSDLVLSDSGTADDSGLALVATPSSGSDVTLVSPKGPGAVPGRTSDTGVGSALSGLDLEAGSGGFDLDSELALSDDDELVLGGDDTGDALANDLALDSGASGISLGSPSDSGLSLEADSGLGLPAATDSGLSLDDDLTGGTGSAISAFELPEDDEESSLLGAVEPASRGARVQPDEEFLLEPTLDALEDESDSGSQVIALEDSQLFSEALVELEPESAAAPAAQAVAPLEAFSVAATAAPTAAAAAAAYAAEPRELPYTIWNLLGLLMIVGLLSITGMMMTDVIMNMWAWEEASDVSSSLSDGITAMVGLDK